MGIRLSGIYNQGGDWAIQAKYGFARGFNEQRAVIKDLRSGKYGYINYDGEEVLPPMFNYARTYNEGLAAISILTVKPVHSL
ncbi:WG repeat-containing protein [Sediminibacterium sp.]|uniref:WG repeat-containing protein n=1 Tax=Sediminibacterium sp. TaxID=1917865 RepID=UPI0025E70CF0|nr:WG repeat-containing protein [Sediminibacterium sp.]